MAASRPLVGPPPVLLQAPDVPPHPAGVGRVRGAQSPPEPRQEPAGSKTRDARTHRREDQTSVTPVTPCDPPTGGTCWTFSPGGADLASPPGFLQGVALQAGQRGGLPGHRQAAVHRHLGCRRERRRGSQEETHGEGNRRRRREWRKPHLM